jgi:predicted nucleotidyltransferase component of viral defense system
MKDLAASILARLAQRRAQTGEELNVLLVRFALERLLYRLYRSSYREQFILKGALLFALWEPTLHRVTRDLDLLGFGHPSADRLTEIFREFCQMEVEADGIVFDPHSVSCQDIRAQDEYAGIRVKLRASIGKAIVPLQVDVGFGDALPVAPEEVTFPVLLGMSAPKLRAYSRETVVAEKLEAMVELGMLNSRFKDYFDLHYLAQNFSFHGVLLTKAIAGTFERRGTPCPRELPIGLTTSFSGDPAKVRGWSAFWRKTGLKAPMPPLGDLILFLVEFLEPPLAAAAAKKTLHAFWRSQHWITE